MSELSSIINQEKENVKLLMMQMKTGKVRKILLNIASNVNENNKLEFYNFLGELLKYNCDYFEKGAYRPILNKIKKYLTDEQLIEMDKYLLSNYCLGSKEKLLAASNGVVVLHEDKIVGRMFLTNMRLICIGELIQKQANPYAGRHGLIGAVVSGAKDARRANIRRALMQRMSGEDVLFFGHQVPIDEAFNIKNSGGGIVYLVNLKEEKRKSVKLRKLKVKVVPKAMKKEPGKDFKVRRVEFLNTFEDTLNNLEQRLPSQTVVESSPPVAEESMSSLDTLELDQFPSCPYCGKELKEESQFCSYCGNSLIDD